MCPLPPGVGLCLSVPRSCPEPMILGTDKDITCAHCFLGKHSLSGLWGAQVIESTLELRHLPALPSWEHPSDS